jgi:hypothetical protein
MLTPICFNKNENFIKSQESRTQRAYSLYKSSKNERDIKKSQTLIEEIEEK